LRRLEQRYSISIHVKRFGNRLTAQENLDRLTPQRRSWLMSRVGSKNTGPELIVRRLAHRMGLRFRLHAKGLPGKPDLVFRKHKAVVFVHGCFWHQHKNCRYSKCPKTRSTYWQAKFDENVARDAKNRRDLKKQGWRILTIWQCRTTNEKKLKKRLQEFFCGGL
jgi:DNA mismatch endonuclease (patch repair protein)